MKIITTISLLLTRELCHWQCQALFESETCSRVCMYGDSYCLHARTSLTQGHAAPAQWDSVWW
jgi:hypothetical protein